jgi:AraC-like DNA-binding protein
VWRLRSERPQTHRQAAELGLGVSLGIFRVLAGEEFKPLEVQLRHAPLVAAEEYEQYFGAPMSFSEDEYGFRFPSELLNRRLQSDAAVHDVVREYLGSVVTPLDDETDDAVRLLIRRMLPTGGLALELVASHLAVHPRTLQRQLAQVGSTFADLVDDVRREEAQRYLTDSRLPLGQIAGLLGYSEQSVLSRSCQRWFGRSPSRVRADAAS